MKKTTRKPTADLLRAYRRLGGIREAAIACNWPESTARRAISEAGEMRQWPRPILDSEADDYVERYADGDSLRRIAEVWHRQPTTVANTLRERGVVVRPRGGRAWRG